MSFIVEDQRSWCGTECEQHVDGEPQVCPESAKGDESGCPLGERGTKFESEKVSDVARQCGDGKPRVCPESAKGDESGCPLGERGTTGCPVGK